MSEEEKKKRKKTAKKVSIFDSICLPISLLHIFFSVFSLLQTVSCSDIDLVERVSACAPSNQLFCNSLNLVSY
jgi:hypothetical protein